MTEDSSLESLGAIELTNEQRNRLDALIEELKSLPLSERIAESARLRCPLPLDGGRTKRMQFALGGAFAAERILYYLESLRAVDARRDDLNRKIAQLIQYEEKSFKAGNAADAAQARVQRIFLSGLLEVELHQFAVCAWRIAVFLPIAARAAGTSVNAADSAVLNSYEPLRHHYEHIEERLPGGKHSPEYVQIELTDDLFRVAAGFQVNEEGKFVINGTTIDVTTRGLRAIERVLQNAYGAMTIQAVEEVRKHFETKPDEIPDPSEIQQNLLFSTWTADLLPGQ